MADHEVDFAEDFYSSEGYPWALEAVSVPALKLRLGIVDLYKSVDFHLIW